MDGNNENTGKTWFKGSNGKKKIGKTIEMHENN